MSILFKIRAIPCVSNYLDPAVSLNSQRGRKALASLALTSVNYSKNDETLEKVSVGSRFAHAYLGRLFFGVAQKDDGSLFYSFFKLLQMLAGSAVDPDEL